jgi:membrane associated rhomboid family serine protease
MDEVVSKMVSSERVGLAVLFAVFAAVVGAFTGLALIWLLRRPILKESELGESAA